MKTLRHTVLAFVVGLVAVACGDEPAPAPAAPHVAGSQITALLQDPNTFLLDVRQPGELTEQGTIEGFTHIHVDELADRLDELPRDRPILVLGASGDARAARAAVLLEENGFEVVGYCGIRDYEGEKIHPKLDRY